MSRQKRLGLALSGGGARGLAHIGFLQVLEEAGIKISALSGTSMGAIVGAGFAIYRRSEIMEEVFNKFLESDLFGKARFGFLNEVQKKQEEGWHLLDWIGGKMKRILFQGLMLTRSGLLSDDVYKEVIDFLIPEVTFDQTKIPFACASLDLINGQIVIFREGRVRLAVQASAALPGLTEPVDCEGHLYSDGGGVMLVPVEPLLEMGAQVIVAVDVDREIQLKESFGNVLEVIIRWADAASSRLKTTDLALADLVVKPEVGDTYWSDFQIAAELIESGRKAARDNLDRIRELVEPERWWSLGRFYKG